MKHIAIIQSEFLKHAAKWEDLSYEQQKGYLSRHPKTRRKLTARPDSSNAPANTENTEAKKHLQEILNGGAEFSQEELTNPKHMQHWIDETKNNFSNDEILQDFPNFFKYDAKQIAEAAGSKPAKTDELKDTIDEKKAEKIMQTGDVILTSAGASGKSKKYYKIDYQGRLWSSNLENTNWTVDPNQKINLSNGFTVVGPQLGVFHSSDNAYFKTTREIPAWIDTGKSEPTGSYYGRSQIYKRTFAKTKLPKNTRVEILHGGDFAVINGHRVNIRFTDPAGDPGVFEKQYHSSTDRWLPLAGLARTEENGTIISMPEPRNYPPIGGKKEEKQPEKKEVVSDKEKKSPVIDVKKENPVVEKKPSKVNVDDIANSFKSLKHELSGYSMYDKEPDVSKDKDDNLNYVSVGFRDLGTWISRPGEEDDDFASWDEKSYNKYKKIFEDWVKRQPWYNEQSMKIEVYTGEKNWAYFGISKK